MRMRGTMGIMAVVVVLVVFGCSLRIGSTAGGLGGADGVSEGGRDEGGSRAEGGGEAGPTVEEIEAGEDTYAQLDSEELALASASAGHYTCALAGAMDAAFLAPGFDAEALDLESFSVLAEQHAFEAGLTAAEWLTQLDPDALAWNSIPKGECLDVGCKYAGTCQKGYKPPVGHLCFIDDCGKAKCSTCPDWVNDILQNIAYSHWCSYVCAQTNTTPPKVVAVGAGLVSKWGFSGPICRAYP